MLIMINVLFISQIAIYCIDGFIADETVIFDDHYVIDGLRNESFMPKILLCL